MVVNLGAHPEFDLPKKCILAKKILKNTPPLKAPNAYTFEVNRYSSEPMRMNYFLWFLKIRKIMAAHWLGACFLSSQKWILLGLLTAPLKFHKILDHQTQKDQIQQCPKIPSLRLKWPNKQVMFLDPLFHMTTPLRGWYSVSLTQASNLDLFTATRPNEFAVTLTFLLEFWRFCPWV